MQEQQVYFSCGGGGGKKLGRARMIKIRDAEPSAWERRGIQASQRAPMNG